MPVLANGGSSKHLLGSFRLILEPYYSVYAVFTKPRKSYFFDTRTTEYICSLECSQQQHEYFWDHKLDSQAWASLYFNYSFKRVLVPNSRWVHSLSRWYLVNFRRIMILCSLTRSRSSTMA